MILYNVFFTNARIINLRSSYFINNFLSEDKLHTEAVIIDNKDQIVLGDKVKVTIQTSMETPYNTYYIANKLYANKREVIISEFEENDSTLFILPMLEMEAKLVMLKSNFINSYIQTTSNFNEIGDCIYLIYRYMPFNNYSRLMSILADNPSFISREKAQDTRFDIVKMAIPERFKKSVELIFEGKYSEIPEYIKHIITKFENRLKDDIIHQTLFNSEELKKKLAFNLGITIKQLPKELRSKPNKNKEIWTN